MRIILVPAVLVSLLLASCDISGPKTAREFFSENKSGSPDYGVMKNGTDHVISVHGFVDNLTNCLEIAEMLSKKGQGGYTCAPLNH